MKFFIDTADLEEIREAASMGLIDGVTTNPSLISKAGHSNLHEVLREICKLVDGPVSGEVVSVESENMVKEGRVLAKIASNMVVKIPLISEGLKAVKILTQEGIKTNVTLCFSATQALLAAKAGGTYISPFVGRIDDTSHDGMELIRQIRKIYDNYGFKTKILAASIRHPIHVLESALAGADVATCPFSVIKQIIKHPLTDIGLATFLKDWEKMKTKQPATLP